LPDEANDALLEYDWASGNVRALKGAVRRAAALADSRSFISVSDLRESIDDRRKGTKPTVAPIPQVGKCSIPFDPKADEWKDVVKRATSIYFRALLETTGGDKVKAISRSGLKRTQFYEKLKETGLDEQ